MILISNAMIFFWAFRGPLSLWKVYVSSSYAHRDFSNSWICKCTLYGDIQRLGKCLPGPHGFEETSNESRSSQRANRPIYHIRFKIEFKKIYITTYFENDMLYLYAQKIITLNWKCLKKLYICSYICPHILRKMYLWPLHIKDVTLRPKIHLLNVRF